MCVPHSNASFCYKRFCEQLYLWPCHVFFQKIDLFCQGRELSCQVWLRQSTSRRVKRNAPTWIWSTSTTSCSPGNKPHFIWNYLGINLTDIMEAKNHGSVEVLYRADKVMWRGRFAPKHINRWLSLRGLSFFSRLNLKLVHIVCHDKQQHSSKQCDPNQYFRWQSLWLWLTGFPMKYTRFVLIEEKLEQIS